MSFLFAISAMAVAIMFPVLLSLRNTGVAGVSRFSAACGLAAGSICVQMAADIAPLWISGIIGAALMIAASIMTLSGFRQFLGRPAPGLLVVATAIALPVLGLALFTYGMDSPAGRSMASGGTIAIVFTLIAIAILADWPQEKSIAPYMIICLVAASGVALFHLLRVLIVLSGIETFPGIVDPRLWALAFPAARILFLPLFFLSIILMVQGKMICTLRHTIAHDDLTGVLSRRAFMAKFERSLADTASAGRPLAFLLLDLDRFKQINDRYGHAGGDAALAHFSDLVGAQLRDHGYIGRLGGEEFGIVLAGIGEAETVEFAERLCAVVRTAPVPSAQSGEIRLTFSAGVAMAEADGNLAEMMIRADMALYEAKAAGRDCFVLADRTHASPAASARALSATAAQMRTADPETQNTPSRNSGT